MAVVNYYQHVIVGSCAGKPVINVLWYYNPLASTDPYANAAQMAGQWAALFAEPWSNPLPGAYTLVRTETAVYNAEWVPQLSAPYSLAVGVPGTLLSNLMGQSPYVPINFTLDYSYGETAPGHPPVRRSYIAYGPLCEGGVDQYHLLVPSFWAAGVLDQLLNCVVNEFTVGDPEATYTPIRVGAPKLTGGAPDPDGYRSWAKVSGANFRSVTSDRASRIPRPI